MVVFTLYINRERKRERVGERVIWAETVVDGVDVIGVRSASKAENQSFLRTTGGACF